MKEAGKCMPDQPEVASDLQTAKTFFNCYSIIYIDYQFF